jgi:hypothetical protein
MDSQSEERGDARSELVGAGGGPLDQWETETDEVPDSLVSEFSSLTTPYCWVITEDTGAGYDGAEPSAVGKSGPEVAVAQDIDGKGQEVAIGRLYDPSGENELSPLDDFARQNLGALHIEYRSEGDWRAA